MGVGANVNKTGFPEGWSPRDCKDVGPYCPIEASAYGYEPNLYANAIFAAWFGLFGCVALGIGIKGRTWSYSLIIFVSSIMETIGYVARVYLGHNPFNRTPMTIQLVTIILAPTICCISIYLTLKHLSLALGRHLSRIRPSLYSPIFLIGDVLCLIMQVIGAVLASQQKSKEQTETGNHLMLAGVVLQVSVLTIFGIMLIDFWIRTRRHYNQSQNQSPGNPGWQVFTDKKFRLFVRGIITAYLLIWVRCVYRIAELQSGYGGEVMQDEISFIILEGLMISLAVAVLTIISPTFFFPQMGKGHNPKSTAISDNNTLSAVELTQQSPSRNKFEPQTQHGHSSSVVSAQSNNYMPRSANAGSTPYYNLDQQSESHR